MKAIVAAYSPQLLHSESTFLTKKVDSPRTVTVKGGVRIAIILPLGSREEAVIAIRQGTIRSDLS